MEDKQKLQWYILITSTTLPKRQYKSKYNIIMEFEGFLYMSAYIALIFW